MEKSRLFCYFFIILCGKSGFLESTVLNFSSKSYDKLEDKKLQVETFSVLSTKPFNAILNLCSNLTNLNKMALSGAKNRQKM